MARLGRADVFSPDEVAICHVMSRVVRRCFLLGDDPVSGKNFDHRKLWVEQQLERLSARMGIDLLCFSILSNHFHLVLRSRPDVVKTWDDSEVARRWLMLCPIRKAIEGESPEPSEAELNGIRNDPDKLLEIRRRLSDMSWWMRLLCQNIGRRANREDEESGRFWQGRYKAVRLLDEAAVLACAAYVDLNPIRAALAETIESSDHTSAQRRVQSLRIDSSVERKQAERSEHGSIEQGDVREPIALTKHRPVCERASTGQVFGDALPSRDIPKLAGRTVKAPDRMLSPVRIDELRDELGPCPSSQGTRASDKGFLNLSATEYIQLLDWTARHTAPGKLGVTPEDRPPILERIGLQAETWCALVSQFGKLFHTVAGRPQTVDATRTGRRQRRHHLTRAARELLEV